MSLKRDGQNKLIGEGSLSHTASKRCSMISTIFKGNEPLLNVVLWHLCCEAAQVDVSAPFFSGVVWY